MFPEAEIHVAKAPADNTPAPPKYNPLVILVSYPPPSQRKRQQMISLLGPPCNATQPTLPSLTGCQP